MRQFVAPFITQGKQCFPKLITFLEKAQRPRSTVDWLFYVRAVVSAALLMVVTMTTGKPSTG